MLKSNYCSFRASLPLYLIWVFLTLLVLAPASNLCAQDPDEEEDLQEFFGDDEEFFEDEEEYLEDEEDDDDDLPSSRSISLYSVISSVCSITSPFL